MKDEKLIGEVSQEQIDKWKADPKILGVSGIIIGGHIAYVKKPDRNTTSYALSQMSITMVQGETTGIGSMEMNMGKVYKQGEAVLINCWLGGSEEIRTDNELWVGACMKAGELIQYKEASLKNY